MNKIGLALERKPVAGGQTRHGKVVAGVAHGLSETASGDVADPVEVSIYKEHGLAQAAAVRRSVSEGNVRSVVQIPGIGRPETSSAEGFEQCVKVVARHIRPMPGQPWTKIIRGPSAGPACQ